MLSQNLFLFITVTWKSLIDAVSLLHVNLGFQNDPISTFLFGNRVAVVCEKILS